MRFTRFNALWLVLVACTAALAGCGERVPPLRVPCACTPAYSHDDTELL